MSSVVRLHNCDVCVNFHINWFISFLILIFQIDNLLQSSKIPIIVGGTNYYIESLLWQNLVSPSVGFKRKKCDILDNDEIDSFTSEVKEFIESPIEINERMEEMESKILHEYLKQIDPSMAHRLHPNNKRKIMR